jgi:hypothetical protein
MEQMGSSRYFFGIHEDFQPLRGEANEQELMKFSADDFDVGASLHVSQPASHPCRARAFKAEERHNPHLLFEIECNLMSRLVSHKVMPLCSMYIISSFNV